MKHIRFEGITCDYCYNRIPESPGLFLFMHVTVDDRPEVELCSVSCAANWIAKIASEPLPGGLTLPLFHPFTVDVL